MSLLLLSFLFNMVSSLSAWIMTLFYAYPHLYTKNAETPFSLKKYILIISIIYTAYFAIYFLIFHSFSPLLEASIAMASAGLIHYIMTIFAFKKELSFFTIKNTAIPLAVKFIIVYTFSSVK